MVIDFHTHTFPDAMAGATVSKLARVADCRPYADGTNAGLRSSMQTAGIDKSVILPVVTNPRHTATVNRTAAALQQDGLISFGGIHPCSEAPEQVLEDIAAAGLKGIKLHPVYQQVDIDDARYIRILKKAGALGLTVVTHCGWDIGFPGAAQALPEKLCLAAERAGQTRLVAAHMGGWRCWEEAKMLADSGVWIDTAFSSGAVRAQTGDIRKEELQLLQKEQFMELVSCFGSHRIVFGSDSPWSDQKESLDFILSLPLTRAQQEDILFKNALRLLNE